MGGQFWVGGWYWGSPSYVSFFQDVCGLELPEDKARAARAYQATAESACWWWPHTDFVIACERPVAIHRDERGRLHGTTGAAIHWPDGWGVYALRGIAVPAELIEHPERLTVARIDAEPNGEVRRVLIEQYGLRKYIVDSGAEVIDQDVEPGNRPRQLLRKRTRKDMPDLLMVQCLNATPEPDGTRKTYFIPVHHELRPLRQGADGTVEAFGEPQKLTAHNAIASTFGKRGEEYRPAIET
jgi:hypothetical protein